MAGFFVLSGSKQTKRARSNQEYERHQEIWRIGCRAVYSRQGRVQSLCSKGDHDVRDRASKSDPKTGGGRQLKRTENRCKSPVIKHDRAFFVRVFREPETSAPVHPEQTIKNINEIKMEKEAVMEILKAVVNSPAGYLDDAVLRLIALQLKQKKGTPGASYAGIAGKRPRLKKRGTRPPRKSGRSSRHESKQ